MLANPALGEVAVKVGRQTFRFVYSFASNAAFRAERGESFFTYVTRGAVEGIDESDVPYLFWLGLQEFHPEVEQDAAYDLARQIGIVETVSLVGGAMAGAYPARKAEGDGDARSPRKSPRSPGTKSAAG